MHAHYPPSSGRLGLSNMKEFAPHNTTKAVLWEEPGISALLQGGPMNDVMQQLPKLQTSIHPVYGSPLAGIVAEYKQTPTCDLQTGMSVAHGIPWPPSHEHKIWHPPPHAGFSRLRLENSAPLNAIPLAVHLCGELTERSVCNAPSGNLYLHTKRDKQPLPLPLSLSAFTHWA